MAAKVNYDELADAIIERLGGKDNISFHTHCVTRLRFNVKDKSLVDKEGIEGLQGVINSLWSGEQYQIVIGNTVNEAYECVAAKLGPVDTTVSEDSPKKKFSFSTIIEIITGIFVPAIPAIAGCGLMKALLSLLTFANLLSTESQTYYILAFVADSAFYFLPMILAFNAANKFKCSPMLAVVLGGVLLHPQFSALVSAGEPVHFLGLPVTLANYANSVIPIILIVWLQSYVERAINRVIPKPVRLVFVPLLTLLITVPFALVVLGPIGTIVGNALATGIMSLENTMPWLIPTIFGAVSPLLVMTGMHTSFYPALFAQLATAGYQTVAIGMLPSNMAQGTATLAVALKTKSAELRELAISAGTSALFGITEPALYGVTLKLKKPLIAVMLGGGLGGLYYGLNKVHCFTPGGTAWTGFATYIDAANPMNVVHMLIGMVLAMAVAFVVTMVIYKEDKPAE